MLSFYLRGKRSHKKTRWQYRVEERDGVLVWVGGNVDTESSRGLPVIKRAGNMATTPVKPHEAIALTGLDHPMAALDRLREMVHEARS